MWSPSWRYRRPVKKPAPKGSICPACGKPATVIMSTAMPAADTNVTYLECRNPHCGQRQFYSLQDRQK